MKSLSGKMQTFSLSTNPKEGRKYLNTNINFGVLRRYFCVDVYDPMNNTGEQREAKDRHISRLRSEMSNFNYTPEAFNCTVPDQSMIEIDNKGNVNIPLSEAQKLVLLNGGSRFRAMMELWHENEKTARMVDDLPIPLIVQLDNEHRKQDFANLNAGMHVSKSHLQMLKIVNGRMNNDKLEIFRRTSDIVKSLHNNESSPLHDKVGFGHIHNSNLLQFTQLCTDHKGSLIASLFGSTKLLNVMEKTDDWFVQFFIDIYKLISEKTGCAESGKLLALPPDGAKGNVANVISIINTTAYYLYLREEMGLPCTLEENQDHIVSCMKIYDSPVAGDVSRKRRQLASQAFGQKLFEKMSEDDSCPVGFHMGLPIPLLVHTSESSFSVEILPSTRKRRKPNEPAESEMIETTEETKIPSDTDPEWSE